MRMIKLTGILCIMVLPMMSTAQKKMSREDYVRAFSGYAEDEMNRSGVPASITLAQGILESDCGNSTLARKANNHFGIKCHKNWTGEKVYHDDDQAKECFRSYPSVKDSYRDHSDFLRGATRYASLFSLKASDYKGWARGLQKAGYATNPHYADLLIKIIEEGNFHQCDVALVPKKTRKAEAKKKKETVAGVELPEQETEFTVDIESRRLYQRNRVDYILVKEGDSYDKLTKELDLMPWDIAHFNECSREALLRPGDPIYLAPKKSRAERGFDVHVVAEGESMHSISQKYALRIGGLYKRNRMAEGSEPVTGEKIWLRKMRKSTEPVKIR